VYCRFDFRCPNQCTQEEIWFTEPIRIVTAFHLKEVVRAMQEVDAAVAEGMWAAGYVRYEAAPAFEGAMQTQPADPRYPLVCFGIFAQPSTQPPITKLNGLHNGQLGPMQPGVTKAIYDEAIGSIRESIGRGDIYQANYTFPLIGEDNGDPYDLYLNLLRSSDAGYCALLQLADHTIVSLSPELFFERSGDNILTRPMKGTWERGRWLEEDTRNRVLLKQSEKDRAENIMIVDLLRNDLGRIAIPGTVHTQDLFHLEKYPTVWQMTSTITAQAEPQIGITQLFTALFPCGSVTGAPKIAAMAQIARVERYTRGAYCGAIGYVKPGGDARFNVAIRTLTLETDSHNAIYPVGGGITWDSRASLEYAEAISKSAVLTTRQPPFEMLETIRLQDGKYYLLDRHLNRLFDSLMYFGRSASRDTVEDTLTALANKRQTGIWRVRLLVDSNGDHRTEIFPLTPILLHQKVQVAPLRVDSSNRFLFHKTTYRDTYDAALKQCPDAFDALLANQNGDLTEFTRGNLVVDINGKRITPHRSSGLLAGTLREELVANGEITEAVIPLEALSEATNIWWINSVRGWISVTLSASTEERA